MIYKQTLEDSTQDGILDGLPLCISPQKLRISSVRSSHRTLKIYHCSIPGAVKTLADSASRLRLVGGRAFAPPLSVHVHMMHVSMVHLHFLFRRLSIWDLAQIALQLIVAGRTCSRARRGLIPARIIVAR